MWWRCSCRSKPPDDNRHTYVTVSVRTGVVAEHFPLRHFSDYRVRAAASSDALTVATVKPTLFYYYNYFYIKKEVSF